MSPSNASLKEVILQLQRIKDDVLQCKSKNHLIQQVDEVIELMLKLNNEELNSLPSTAAVQQVRYLKEIRMAALDLNEEQISEFCRDVGMTLGSMQFQLWQGRNEELLALLQKA